MTKKKVFVTALAVSLIAIISMGTLAWFNANDEITNTFKVATNENDTDPTFTVEVTETDLEGNTTDSGVTYYDVLPGDVIEKDPTITNTGDYSQWIRATVTMTSADKWAAAGGSLKFKEVFEGSTYGLAADVATATEEWLLVSDEATLVNGSAVWYLYLNSELEPADSAVVFEKVNIEENFTLEEILGFDGYAITVKADAVQFANTGDNAVEAFDAVGWTVGTDFVDQN